jgi:hypothetical protein
MRKSAEPLIPETAPAASGQRRTEASQVGRARVDLQKIVDAIDHSPRMTAQRRQLEMLVGHEGHAAPRDGAPVQLFKLKDYRSYKGILAGDPGIDTEKAEKYTRALRAGAKFPPIKIQKGVRLMRRKGAISKHWDEFNPKKDKKAESVKKTVVTDGHHRFVAYVECGLDPRDNMVEEDEAVFAYNWSELGGIDHEMPDESESSSESES